MAKTINPKVTITEGKTIQTIWTGIPDFKMGTIGAEEFNRWKISKKRGTRKCSTPWPGIPGRYHGTKA